MNSPNARLLVPFYEQAFGARVTRRGRADIGGAGESTALRLGDSTLELLEFDQPGRPYPAEISPYDTRFQHLAIVVTDMRHAMARLLQTPGWTAISKSGPQRLPQNAGGVTAFKFRDPDGHPLEFLQFAAEKTPAHWQSTIGPQLHLGIDHSAITVADAARSVRFYESLGLTPSNRSLNQGIEQEHLDGVPAPIVDVIAMTLHHPTPHLELLHYHTPSRAMHDALRSHDAAATRLVLVDPNGSSNEAGRIVQDPDGHFLQFENH